LLQVGEHTLGALFAVALEAQLAPDGVICARDRAGHSLGRQRRRVARLRPIDHAGPTR
jgi:hypothetical protein